MKHFIDLLFEDTVFFLGTLSFLLLFLFLFLLIIQYFYVSYNLKDICKILFNNEKEYKVPLEPFNFYFISILPIALWREVLNVKKNKQFKKLYGKEFYFNINKQQLIELLDKYPYFFRIQYTAFFFGILWLIFQTIAYIIHKYL